MTPTARRPCRPWPAPGVAPGLMATGPPGRGDDRVVALQHDDRAASARPPRGRERGGGRRPGSSSTPSSRPSSPACGVRTVGAAARAQQLERARVGVEPVGVDQQRHRHAQREPARERAARRRAAEPGPEHDARPPRSAQLAATSSAPAGDVRAVVVGQRARHHLEQLQLERRAAATPGTRDLHVARAGAHARRSAAMVGAPVSPRAPPATTTVPRAELRRRRARGAGTGSQHARRDQARRGVGAARRAGCRSRPTSARPAWLLPGLDVQADLRAVEGRGERRRAPHRPATSPVDGVHAAGHVAGHHRARRAR